jgi:hypothetical protein
MGAGFEGKIFKIGDGIEGGLSDDGKRLPVYSIGDTTYQSSRITKMNWPDGRYFGEAGGSGKSMIHQFGENIGRHFNCPAGGEGKSFVYVGSEVSSE